MENTYTERYVYIDFEFNNSAEPNLNLVSCSLMFTDLEKPGELVLQEYWLKDDEESKELLRQWIAWFGANDYTFVAYAITAEARCLLSLGLNSQDYQWICLYSEWLQLTFNNESCEYGTYFQGGMKRESVAPKLNPALNRGKNNTPIRRGYGAVVAQLFEVDIDQSHKTAMRDLILENKDKYSREEIKNIVQYCTSDIKWLPPMLKELTARLQRAIKADYETVRDYQNTRARFMVSVAKMEQNGYPVRADQIHNLRDNFEEAQDTILQDLVDNHYPFYVREKKRASDIRWTWTAKYELFEQFLVEKGLDAKWPRTDSGKFSTEDKVLDDFSSVTEIKALRNARKMITQLAWFKEPDDIKRKKNGDFFDAVGSDNRLRTFLGAYGTQSCSSGETLVLSKERGLLRITEVTIADHLWDGEEFVSHEGLKFTGFREVIDFNGLRFTPDHLFLNDNNEWERVDTISNPMMAEIVSTGGENSSKNEGREYVNPTGSTISRIVKRSGAFESGFIATNVHFSNQLPTKAKDRYKRNSAGEYLGDILSTPSYYDEAHVKHRSMVRRVLNKVERVSYRGAILSEEWKNFSNFAEWYEVNRSPLNTNPVIDKDFIVQGNREYSPEKCLVITERLNSFLAGTFERANKGQLPIGVYKTTQKGVYCARISIAGTTEQIGVFDTIALAEEAYLVAKENLFSEILEEEKEYLTENTYNLLKTWSPWTGCASYNEEKRVPVYDITNCGPRSRFAVYNNDLEGFIAHNSRNAPKASRFILAMSSWLRCLIQPPKGKVIIGCDYSSQEFQIAGWLANDPKMIEAYDSGDPYLYFAKEAGAVPKEADPKLCKNPVAIIKNSAEALALDPYHLSEDDLERIAEVRGPIVEKYKEHLEYAEKRNLFKSTTLGLQFGMGFRKLAIKLTYDMGRAVSEKESEKLVRLHKRLYRVFWKWAEQQERLHKRQKYLTLWDGWSLLGDIDNSLSIKNFPVQGTGAVIMRRAVELIEEKGIAILSPLHDAIYVEAEEANAQETADIVAELMKQATREVLGNTTDSRIDVDIHTSEDVWIEGKGAKHYELLKKYLEKRTNKEATEQALKDNILKDPSFPWAEWGE